MPHFSSSHLLADGVAGDEKRRNQKVLATRSVRYLEPSSLYPDKGVKKKEKKRKIQWEEPTNKRFDFLHPYTIH
jgi:hypothetical protein